MKKDVKLAEKVLKHFEKEINPAPASAHHHLNIFGGLPHHLANTLGVAQEYFPKDEQLHFMALIHDIGKARVYEYTKGKVIYKEPSIDHIMHTIEMLHEVGITLTDEELNALQFHHGSWSKSKGKRTQLAIKLHFCDSMAVAIEPHEEDD